MTNKEETCKCMGVGELFNLDENLEEQSKKRCPFCGKKYVTLEELKKSKEEGYVQILTQNFYIY